MLKVHKLIVIGTIVITLFLGYSLKNLKINPDIMSYMPEDDPLVKNFDYVGDLFGGNMMAMIVLEADDIFNHQTLKQIAELTEKIQGLDGVQSVTSLTNILNIEASDEGLEIGPLIDPDNLPETAQELAALKQYTHSRDMYQGNIISRDGKETIIICRLNRNGNQIEIARNLKKVVQQLNMRENVYYGGQPFLLLGISDMIIHDLKFLIPLVFLFILITLGIGFQNIPGVILPLLSVSLSTIWTLGIMAMLKVPITIISDIIPVVLFAVGSAYSIHVVTHFQELKYSKDRLKGAVTALTNVGIPVILAGATTILGFISFIFGSYLTAIKQFGIFCSLGILFSLIISLTFIPALIYWSNPRGLKKKKSFGLKTGRLILKEHRLITVAGLLVMMTAGLGIPEIERKVDILNYFRPETDFRRTEMVIQEKFGGSTPIQILVKGEIEAPSTLIRMKKIETFLDSFPDIHNTQSVADLIEWMNEVMGEGRRIPQDRAKVSNLFFLLEGEEIMAQLINSDKSEALIQATLTSGLRTQRVHQVVLAINKYLANMNTPSINFYLTGMPPIHCKLDQSIKVSLLQSLLLAIIAVFIILILMMRNPFYGLVGLLPIAFSLTAIFGFMGYTKIPLDIATVLVGSISIGIGVDYSIHLLNRFSRERKRGLNTKEAMARALDTTGNAIFINDFTVILGFLALTFAQLIPLQNFGILVAITMLGAGLGALLILPSVIILIKKRRQ